MGPEATVKLLPMLQAKIVVGDTTCICLYRLTRLAKRISTLPAESVWSPIDELQESTLCCVVVMQGCFDPVLTSSFFNAGQHVAMRNSRIFNCYEQREQMKDIH